MSNALGVALLVMIPPVLCCLWTVRPLRIGYLLVISESGQLAFIPITSTSLNTSRANVTLASCVY
jgi:hypothetical protein